MQDVSGRCCDGLELWYRTHAPALTSLLSGKSLFRSRVREIIRRFLDQVLSFMYNISTSIGPLYSPLIPIRRRQDAGSCGCYE